MTNGTTTSSADLIRRLALAFHEAGEELYLVGGAIRDEMLGMGPAQQSGEHDFATSARPERTLHLLESAGIRTIYRVGEKFGTIGAVAGETILEITTYRSETYQPGSRKPEVEFGRTLLEDLSRRDFTINAMARDPLSGELVDPFDGRRDLGAGLIRAVGEPADRFQEDPLRLLRAVRFASRLRFEIEENTWLGTISAAPRLESVSRERIRDEYDQILAGPDPVRGMTLLRDSTLLAHSVPELLQLTTMKDHGPRHPLSLWDHVMLVLAHVPAILAVRWAALLHDIAKPATRQADATGRPRFFGHEEVGARLAREILTGLRYSNDFVDSVVLLVETHMQLHAYTPDWSDGAVRRLMLRLGPQTSEAIQLARADGAGHSLTGRSVNEPRLNELEARIHALATQPPETLVSPLSGDDLMGRYGRPPGPWIRDVKSVLESEVIEGRLAPGDRERAWEIADQLVSRQG